jgi:twitching motility protein PilT
MDTIATNELDHLLTAMIQSAEGISDLLFVAGKPPQVEVHGALESLAFEWPESVLTGERIESLAGAIINNNGKLLRDLSEHGSCDCSYALENLCRFRVNIYRQNGSCAMVLRRLPSEIPSLESLGLPPRVSRDRRGKDRPGVCDRRFGQRQNHHARGVAERNQPDEQGPCRFARGSH